MFLPGHWSRIQPNKKTAIVCENCGKELLRPQWHLKKVNRNFCNPRCFGEHASRTGSVQGAANGHYNTITVPCAACGKPVSKARSLIERRNHRVYCDECIPLTRRGRKGFYVGYPPEFNANLRHRIRKRDNFTCQLCDKHQDQVGTLHVHHIDYNKRHNSPINLISLCRLCHGKTNFGQAYWKDRLQSFMLVRF